MTLIQVIELFYDGFDDKVYIDLYVGSDANPIFNDIRIIDSRLRPYYDREIIALFESKRLSIIVERGKDA